jgi:hypothetical protein
VSAADFTFPFPSRELAYKELSRDPCYGKIPPEDREAVVDRAWKKGEAAAAMIREEWRGEGNFFVIASQCGLRCRRIPKDYVLGGRRYFCEYISGQNLINMYTLSISLWAEENNLPQEDAENLILGHEFFHFLEWTRLGLSSRDYQVPIIRIGKLRIGKTGIRALSEIGAHAFSRACFEIGKGGTNADTGL